MSISRKRVGSVSQRNDSPLPPLDIQSIHMPSNPQNALALKTAALSSTKSLFQMASSLRKRLRNVDDFGPFLDQPSGAPQLDVVSHMCHVFRLGSSLCHLYNLLIPSFTSPSSALFVDLAPPHRIPYEMPSFMDVPDGVRNWAKRPENAKSCQKLIAMFCMAMKQRREEGRWQGEPCAFNELWGKSAGKETEIESYDSTGLMKVFQTVEGMLDNLPESAVSPTSQTPTTPFGPTSSQSFSTLAPMTSGAASRQSADMSSHSLGNSTSGSISLVNVPGANGSGLFEPEAGVGAAAAAAGTAAGGPGPSPAQQQRASEVCTDNAFKTVEELVNSERRYVQELEVLERCSVEIVQEGLVSAETSFSMFSNLGRILDFQRKFLIKLETEYEPIEEYGSTAWTEGRWGRPFVDMEKEFECYGPYCANYMEAIKVVGNFMVNLMLGQDLPEGQRPCLHPERELQAFMIKPIQRITKYGLLLDAIVHATAKHNYLYSKELEDGLAAVRRIAVDINETTAIKAKEATVRELIERVEDWKGHDHEKFGQLHLDDVFTVSKADSPREYHVYLFEKMMLCCKEIPHDKKGKGNKNNNMLRKGDKTASKSGFPAKPRVALKGRIFVSNITTAVLLPPPPNEPFASPRVQIVWSVSAKAGEGETDVEDSFIMSGRSEDTMKRWADKVMELAVAARKHHEEARIHHARHGSTSRSSDGGRHPYWSQSQFAPPTPAPEHGTFQLPPIPTPGTPSQNGYHLGEEGDENPVNGLAIYGVPGMPPGMPFPPNTNTNRRAQSQQSIPTAHQAELRTRAKTEDQNGPSMTQWRTQQVPPLPPPLPRITSNGSMNPSEVAAYRRHPSHGGSRSGIMDDELPYANGPPSGGYPNPRGAGAPPPTPGAGDSSPYEPPQSRGMSRVPSQGVAQANGQTPQHPVRNRSVSTPNVYPNGNNGPLPPLPPGTTMVSSSPSWNGATNGPYPSGSATSSSTGLGSTPGGTAYFTRRMSTGKRSSSESQTTETSETSSQSPRTPYTNPGPGDLRGATPVSRQNSQEVGGIPSTLLLKVRSGESNFVIGVANDVSYQTLYEKVVKKLRLCSAQHAAGGLDASVKIKWLDSDGDEVVINTDSDVQCMLIEAASEQIQLIAV